MVINRDLMTEAEARKVGHSATRIAQLRDLLRGAPNGSTITVKIAGASTCMNLGSLDTTAALSLLIEREGQFLSSMGVIMDKPKEG